MGSGNSAWLVIIVQRPQPLLKNINPEKEKQRQAMVYIMLFDCSDKILQDKLNLRLI
jgi:hypothetical protein